MSKMGKQSLHAGWKDGLTREEEKRLLLGSVLFVFLWGLAAHAYGFLHGDFSHDMLNALVVDNVETYWKMQLGRLWVVLYRRTIRGVIAAPWLCGVLGLFWISLSCFLTAKLFRIRSRFLLCLLAGVLTVNLTTIAMTATYLYEFDFDMFALLLGVMAVFLWDRYGWTGSLVGALFVTGVLGLYQSYVCVVITLVMLLSITALLRGEAFGAVFKKGLRGVCMLLIGALLYYGALQWMCAVKGITLNTNSYNSVYTVLEGDAKSPGFLATIGAVYRNWAGAFFNRGAAHIEMPVWWCSIALAVCFVAGIILWLVRGKSGAAEKILLVVLAVLLPFGMNATRVLSGRDVHDLMKYAFWLTYPACLLPWFVRKEDPSAANGKDRLRFVRPLSALLVLIVLISNVQTANIVYTKKGLEQDATLAYMTRVVDSLEKREDYVPGETPLVIVGLGEPMTKPIPGFEAYYDITGCDAASPIASDTVTYYYNAYAAYFRYIMNEPAQMADAATWNAVLKDARVRAMPCWPAEGSMQLADDVFVVKLGEPSAAPVAEGSAS
ncbi:MAG: glucosyltransferase domain-containing protein [Oscillospiraceae bacterium]|nr:glucosyltransferase domain-containing protein [Oscillospiraceae bacterium]